MPMTLEAVDPQHPNTVALLRGPLTLFAIGDDPVHVSRAQMLAASQSSSNSDTWKVKGQGGEYVLKPYSSIASEKYRLYHDISA
jgi:hypothetical protein